MATREHPQVVVMGVAAVGKSTVAAALSDRLGMPEVDADALHPAPNVAKMAAGIPLTDDDRWPWLDRVSAALTAGSETGVVVACSALRRAYRDRIRHAAPAAVFVHLTGDERLLATRARSRIGHFMPAALLPSQFAALEPLDPDERGFAIDVDQPVARIVDAIVVRLASAG